jgi:hypothetical protein
MDFGIVGVLISLLGSVITTAVMVGSMRASIQHINSTLTELSRQHNEHLQFHLKTGAGKHE